MRTTYLFAFCALGTLLMFAGCQALGNVLPATTGEMASLGEKIQGYAADLAELGTAVEQDAQNQVGIETVLTAAAGSTAVGGWLLNTLRNSTRKRALSEQERIRRLPEGEA